MSNESNDGRIALLENRVAGIESALSKILSTQDEMANAMAKAASVMAKQMKYARERHDDLIMIQRLLVKKFSPADSEAAQRLNDKLARDETHSDNISAQIRDLLAKIPPPSTPPPPGE
jgi:hypothetical protein